jgi:hypothetical protein
MISTVRGIRHYGSSSSGFSTIPHEIHLQKLCLLAGLREQGSNQVKHLALYFESRHVLSLDFPLLTPETGNPSENLKGSLVLSDVVEEMSQL